MGATSILVSGASEGMGGAICRRFAERAKTQGGVLSITLSTSGRNGPPQKLIEDIEALGARANFVAADLANAEDCVRLAEAAVSFGGGIDHFVSNAGAMRSGALKDLSVADWDTLFDINVRPTFVIGQVLYPALKQSKGTITAVSSVVGHVPSPGTGAYPPSKSALDMLVRQMAIEWAPDGIRVNAVAPGMIRTPLTERAYQDPETHAMRIDLVPLGRIGTIDDIASAVLFLSSKTEASYVTGQILSVDGGFVDSIYCHLPPLK